MTPVLESKGFAAAVIDALASHLCVVDRNGVIKLPDTKSVVFGPSNTLEG